MKSSSPSILSLLPMAIGEGTFSLVVGGLPISVFSRLLPSVLIPPGARTALRLYVLALYEAQRRKLESIAARLVGRQEAADVVQTAFTYFLGRLDTLTHIWT
jgi:hypothetical protein